MKSQFVWNVPGVSTDHIKFVEIMKKANIDTAIIWVCDGSIRTNSYGSYSSYGKNLKKELVDLLHNAGIKVFGWGAVYGSAFNDPKSEGEVAGDAVKELGLDGYVFDVEGKADSQPNNDSDGAHRCIEYRKVTDKPLYLCWWIRYKDPVTGSQWHPDHIPARQLLMTYDKYVNGYMPMCYWYTTKNDPDGIWWAENMLRQGFDQYREVTQKPITPIGRSYIGDGADKCTVAAMKVFAKTADELGCAGLSWWSAEHAIKLPGVYEAIGEIHGGAEYPELPEDPEPPEPIEETTMIVNSSTGLNIRDENNKIIGGLLNGAEVKVIGESGTFSKSGRTYQMVDISVRVASELLRRK